MAAPKLVRMRHAGTGVVVETSESVAGNLSVGWAPAEEKKAPAKRSSSKSDK